MEYLFRMATKQKTRRTSKPDDLDGRTSLLVTKRTRLKLKLLAESMRLKPSRTSLVEHLVDEALKLANIDPETVCE